MSRSQSHFNFLYSSPFNSHVMALHHALIWNETLHAPLTHFFFYQLLLNTFINISINEFQQKMREMSLCAESLSLIRVKSSLDKWSLCIVWFTRKANAFRMNSCVCLAFTRTKRVAETNLWRRIEWDTFLFPSNLQYKYIHVYNVIVRATCKINEWESWVNIY